MLSYRKKMSIDRVLGPAVVDVLRLVVGVFGSILRVNHRPAVRPRVVAVAKISGMGSITYAGILCRALKEQFPGTRVVFVTSGRSLGLVRKMPHVDEVLTVSEQNVPALFASGVALLFRLWRRQPELYFDLEVYSHWSAVVATMSLARNRYGFVRKGADFKKSLHTHTVFFNPRRHLSEIYGLLARAAGCTPRAALPGLLAVTDDDRRACGQVIGIRGIAGTPIVVVHTSTSDQLAERRWPRSRWVAYLEQVAPSFSSLAFVLTGAPGDRAYVAEVHEQLPEWVRRNVYNLTGELPFGLFLSLIERSLLLVTNDSGPAQFAAALGKPTISIWGPRDPEHSAPRGGEHVALYQPVYCSPCLYQAEMPPCGGDNACVRQVGVETAVAATRRFLQPLVTP